MKITVALLQSVPRKEKEKKEKAREKEKKKRERDGGLEIRDERGREKGRRENQSLIN